MAPSIVALVAWFALNAFAAVWSVRRVALCVRPDLEQRPETVAVLLAVFFTVFFPIVQSNLRNGQVNFIVLALCVAAALPRHNRQQRLNASDTPDHPDLPTRLFYTGAGAPCTISHRQLEMESSDIGNSFRRSSVHQAFAFGLSAEPAEPPPRPLQRRAPQTGERSGDRHRPIVVVGVRYRVLGEAKRFGGNG